MEKDILTFNNDEYLHPMLYSNIIGTAIYLRKFDEAKNIISKYKERVSPERRDTAVNFNMAKLLFAENKYDEAHEYLSKVQQEDVFYKVAIKGLYAQIYYEKEFTETELKNTLLNLK